MNSYASLLLLLLLLLSPPCLQATLSRPALVPRELGALHFRYEEGLYRLLRYVPR